MPAPLEAAAAAGGDPRRHRRRAALRVVVDTDVLAAALLGEAGRGEQAGELLHVCEELLAPSHYKAELADVVWKAVLLASLEPARIEEVLGLAGALPVTAIDVGELWHGAVARSVRERLPVYDMLFVELAVREGLLMASYDGPLRRRFPHRVRHPSTLLGMHREA